MIKIINLKNNKGISLASVLVTVILMLVILTSIVLSNARTNEIKKAMLINSDIEELTKKAELYYLEKETLPIDKTSNNYMYEDIETDEGKAKYYKLEVSLLENINLNNKEIIDNTKPAEEQWYVMNEETHTIYFVKREGGIITPQIAQYSNGYNNIIGLADSSIIFNNTTGGNTSGSGETTTIKPGKDDLVADSSAIDIGVSDPTPGEQQEGGNYAGSNQTGPDPTSGDGGAYSWPYDYVGYSNNWTPGTKSSSLVLHYDGIYNTLSGSTISHSSSEDTRTWSDLSGNGNDARIVNNSTIRRIEYRVNKNESYSEHYEDTYVEQNANTSIAPSEKSMNLNNQFFIREVPNNIPSGSSQYTIEIVYKNEEQKSAGLLGMGTYNNFYISGEGDSTMFNDATRTSDGGSNVNLGGFDFGLNWHAYSSNRIFLLNNIYKNKFNGFVPYAVCKWGGEIVTTSDPNNGTEFSYWNTLDYVAVNSSNNGRANAVKTSSDGKGIASYYWGVGDIITPSIISKKIHTVTVKSDGSNTYIYIDGDGDLDNNNSLDTYSISPNTLVEEITVGATNEIVKTYLNDTTKENYRVVRFELDYEEFFKGDIYSVRIYNTALTDQQIIWNHITDKLRFGF